MARYNVDLQDDKGNAYQTMANPDSVAEFSPAPSRENIKSGETHRVIFGKIMKYLSEVGNAAYVGLANNCTTTVEGFALDARQGKELMDRINELNRDLGGLSFGQDAEGNWGYKTGGADPVIPFKTEPFVYDFSDGTFNLSDSSKPYYIKDYKKLTKQNFHGSCSWSCYEYFHHTDTADHEHRNSGGISFTYSPDTGTLIVKRYQTNGFITLVC